MKLSMKDIALKTFENTGINIAEGGWRRLGGVIGSIEYRQKLCDAESEHLVR